MEEKSKIPTLIQGDVNTQGGDFVGRDKVELNIYPYFAATPRQLRRSFDALMKDKLQRFVGREFVFDALDDFLNTHDSGYFILRGAPGVGKSAFMAKLVNERGYFHHFNIASQNIRSTRSFLENVVAQLIEHYDLPHKELPSRAFDDSGFLMQCLSEAVEKNGKPGEKIVIAIDALDEVNRQYLGASANILFLPPSLPDGVYVVATTRPLDDLPLQVAQQKILDFQEEKYEICNLEDITTYIENYTKREKLEARLLTWGVSQEQFVTGLREKSQGNFMYLYHVLPAIERGEFVHGRLDELPDGLIAYYQRHWRQMKAGNADEFDQVYEPIVCILGVAKEPVTVEQIANWTKLSQGKVKTSIRLWREFLEKELLEGVQLYRIYHASFQDFLKDQVDLDRYHDMVIDYYLTLAALNGE